jgi:hypothetical protein
MARWISSGVFNAPEASLKQSMRAQFDSVASRS